MQRPIGNSLAERRCLHFLAEDYHLLLFLDEPERVRRERVRDDRDCRDIQVVAAKNFKQRGNEKEVQYHDPAGFLLENNYRYSRRLCEWALGSGARFVYASSAATYGDGTQGYDDTDNGLPRLKPLNMYGYSKQLCD